MSKDHLNAIIETCIKIHDLNEQERYSEANEIRDEFFDSVKFIWLIEQTEFLHRLLESEAIYDVLRAEYKNPSMLDEKWYDFFQLFQEFQEKRELRSDKQ